MVHTQQLCVSAACNSWRVVIFSPQPSARQRQRHCRQARRKLECGQPGRDADCILACPQMAGNPDALMVQMRQRLAASPLAQKAAADPGFMRGVIAANPALSGMLDGNPRLKQLLTSPDAIQGLLSGARHIIEGASHSRLADSFSSAVELQQLA